MVLVLVEYRCSWGAGLSVFVCGAGVRGLLVCLCVVLGGADLCVVLVLVGARLWCW